MVKFASAAQARKAAAQNRSLYREALANGHPEKAAEYRKAAANALRQANA